MIQANNGNPFCCKRTLNPLRPRKLEGIRGMFCVPEWHWGRVSLLEGLKRPISQADDGATTAGFWFHLSFLLSEMGLRTLREPSLGLGKTVTVKFID